MSYTIDQILNDMPVARVAIAIYPILIRGTPDEGIPFDEAMRRPRHLALRMRVFDAAQAAAAAIEVGEPA